MESGTVDVAKDFPLVSVIIGTKDRPKLITRAVDSVLGQTYKNFECIIIDSSCTTETENIIQSIDDSRIKYSKLYPDPGRVNSLNFGITCAQGKYVSFLDDDDEYFREKLENQVNSLENSSEIVGMSYCWSMYYDEKEGRKIYELTNDIRGYVFLAAMEKMAFCSFIALMFKRDRLIEIGITDEANYPSDWLFVARFTKKYHVIDVPTVLVKVNVNHIYDRMSAPRIKNNEYFNSTLRFHKHFYMLFEEDYNRHPRIARVHLYSIIGTSAFLKLYSSWFKYCLIILKLEPFSLSSYYRILRSIGTFIKNLR
jgi:glycosyltransferase involved in cell wall biosynthesis